MKSPRIFSRRAWVTGAALALAGAAIWAAIFVEKGVTTISGDASNTAVEASGGGRDWASADAAAAAAASGDPIILASIQTKANQNKIMRGQPGALSSFETVRPSGALTALPVLGDPVKGTFSPVVDWPLVGIHAVLTFDGRVLTYGTTTEGVRTAYYVYDIWDPQQGLGSASHTVLPNTTAVDIFCNAQLLLPDGDIEMWGGDVVNLATGKSSLNPTDDTAIFRPLDNSLTRTGKMFRKRWYATATTLPNGEVYIQGGDGGVDFPEVRTGIGQFRLLSGAPTTYLGSLYPRNFLAPDGKIFGTRYEEMYRVDPAGTGAITTAGRFTTGNMGASSTAVMFRPGKVLQVGGGYDKLFANPNAHVIDFNPTTPVIHAVAPPIHRRHWADGTVLPDGRVFLSGGSTALNDPTNGVAYTSEIYDPDTNSWSEGATAQQMRLYHSASILLPDATVLTLGGGVNGPQLNLNAEIYYPPYLFRADGTPAPRPIITSLPMTTDPRQSIRIATPLPAMISRVTLVKTGSVTHSFDMDQRFMELPFTVVGSELKANLPANAFETPPGYYMVFIFDDKGVPSEAAMLRINVQSQPQPSATLTVKKIVVNDSGGNKQAADFSFSVNGATPVPFQASGTNVLSVPAGTYTVTEPTVAGYAASLANCTGIVLAEGGSATCTITNDDDTAGAGLTASVSTGKPTYIRGETVTISARVLLNGVAVSGARVNFDALKPNGINRVLLNATTGSDGFAHVSFVSGTGPSSIGTYQLTATATSGGLTAIATTTFVVQYDESPPPTPATLNVTKIVVNNDGGNKLAADFSFSVNGATPVPFQASGTNVLSVPAGTYTVTEPAVAGYAASLANCTGIVLAEGGSATCTITNDDQAEQQPATLTVRKVVVNDSGGNKQATDFSFSVNGATPVPFQASGTNVLSVPAGTYTVTEPTVAGYAASLANCTGIVLAEGGSATCTITNDDDTAGAGLTASVSTGKPTYIRGETVTISARVLLNGIAVSGARVNFDALKPKGKVSLKATTDSDGIARVSFVSGTGASSIGTYRLTATATSGGLTATATTTFVVQ